MSRAAGGYPEADPEPLPADARPSGPPGLHVVVHEKVAVRSGPSTKAAPMAVHPRGTEVPGTPYTVGGLPWLRLDRGWMLVDGASVGLGRLLDPVADIVEDIVAWAEQQRETKAIKHITWTEHTAADLRKLAAAAGEELAPLRRLLDLREEKGAALEELRGCSASLAGTADATLGADAIHRNALRHLLRKRAVALLSGEEERGRAEYWSEEQFRRFMDEKIMPRAPFHCRVFTSSTETRRVLVLLHGAYVRGDDLIEEAETLQRLMPETAVVLPEGPTIVDEAHELRAWWRPIAADGIQDGWLAVPQAAVQRASATVRWASARFHGAPLVLSGFSQGSALLAQTLAALQKAPSKANIQLTGFIVLSGLAKAFEVPSGVRCLAIHGDSDDRIAVEDARRAASDPCFKDCLTFEEIPGLAHEVSNSVLERIAAFCDEVAPVARQAMANQAADERVEEMHRAMLHRFVMKMSKGSTMYDDNKFMEYLTNLDMRGLGPESPALGDFLRYHVHSAGPESQGTVILFHGALADLRTDTERLARAYADGLQLSVCVVDYRQRFSQLTVDAQICLDELEELSGSSTKPVIIHAVGIGAIPGIHMAMASQAMSHATRRRLRALVLDAPIANFKSLPRTIYNISGCIAMDPIGNDQKLTYVEIPLCILAGDDARFGAATTSSHWTTMSNAARAAEEDGKLAHPACLIPDTALVSPEGEPRFRIELYDFLLAVLRPRADAPRAPGAEDSAKFLGALLREEGQELDDEVLLAASRGLLDAIESDEHRRAIWDLRRSGEPGREARLAELVSAISAPVLGKHEGFKGGAEGFQQYEAAASWRSESHPGLRELNGRIREGLNLARLDALAADTSLGLSVDQCHVIIEKSIAEWDSQDMLDLICARTREAGGSGPACSKVIRDLGPELNLKRAKELGRACDGDSHVFNLQLGAEMQRCMGVDPTLSGRMAGLQGHISLAMSRAKEQLGGFQSGPAAPAKAAAPAPKPKPAEPARSAPSPPGGAPRGSPEPAPAKPEPAPAKPEPKEPEPLPEAPPRDPSQGLTEAECHQIADRSLQDWKSQEMFGLACGRARAAGGSRLALSRILKELGLELNLRRGKELGYTGDLSATFAPEATRTMAQYPEVQAKLKAAQEAMAALAPRVMAELKK